MALSSAEKSKRYRERHPERVAKTQERKRKKESPEKRRSRWLKYKYGISLEQFERMLESQGGCAVCGAEHKTMVVDHCHATGKVRGILCKPCNTLLGHAYDDAEVLSSAAAYIRGHG